MNLRRLLGLICLSFLILQVSAQQKTAVTKVYTSKQLFEVTSPYLMDSVNIKGVKADNKSLLETSISKNVVLDQPIETGVGGYFYLQKAQKGGRFHLLQFELTTDRYSKVKVKLTAPSMLELYVNGKKEYSKTSIEDSITSAKVSESTITSSPRTNTILIKYLSLSTNKAPEVLKISIECEGSDSATVVSLGHKTRRLSINDIMEGTRIQSTQISPNGSHILLNYKTVLDGGKEYLTSELYDVKNGTRKELNLSSKILGWTPLSNKLYYTQQGEKGTNLITVDPQTLSNTIIAEDIPTASFNFSPNEKYLLFNEKESGDERKGDLKLLGSAEDRQPGYYDRYFISKYDLSTGINQRLVYGKLSTYLNDISADSRYILYSVSEETPTERPFSNYSMFKLDLQTMTVDTIWSREKFAHAAQFSPDGKSILIQGSGEAFGGISLNIKEGQISNSYNGLVFIMDLASKKVDPIAKDFNPSINSAYWNIADNKIYLRTVDRDYENIYSYDTKSRSFNLLPLNEDVVQQISLASKTPLASYYGQSVSNSTIAYTLDLSNLKSKLITDPFKERLASIKLGEMKDWTFVSSDGTTIEGRYYLPPNFDASKKYPMIVYYYSGTTPTARMLDHRYSMHLYAAMGYVVYTLQPSGTIGYGQEFAARHVNAWGIRTAEDIIEGVKEFTSKHSFVDASKVGCIGASYGGFMTMYLQTRTDIFAAAVSHAGISALSSYWGEGYWGYTYSAGASANSYPWNNKELYVEQSPLFNADKINTPLLLLHGTDDTNVPMGESIQMFTALRILGKPVEFIQVKGENHGIVNYNKRLEWNYSIYAWFDKWLKNDSAWWNSLYKQP